MAAVYGKAVLLGGECDGQVVRLNFDPPVSLVVLIDTPRPDANGEPVPVDEAFVAPVNAFPAAAAGRPVFYRLFSMAGLPEGSRVALYVPSAPTTTP